MIHGRLLSSLWSSALALCHTEPGLKSDPSWHYHYPLLWRIIVLLAQLTD